MTKATFSENSPRPQEDVSLLLKRGAQLLHRGELPEAVAVLEKAQAIEPANPDVALNLSGGYILTRRFKQAVDILEPLSVQEPHNAMVWTNLGAAYLGNPVLAKDEEHEKAIAAFKRALEINPTTPNVAYNLGLIYRDRQEKETAVLWFERALQANPQDKDAQAIIARLQGE